jgi:ketosteroid isomerase-like protein
MTDTKELKELMTKYYKAGSTADWTTLQELLHENVVVDEQLAGHLEGHPAMKALYEGIQKSYKSFDMCPEHMVAEGNEICVGWQVNALTSNGVPIHATGAHYCRIENGKIVYMTNFHDTIPWKVITASRSDDN